MKIPICHPFRLGLAVCATLLVSAAPLLGQRSVNQEYQGKESSKFNRDCTICHPCL